ncbi:hypothetical protein ASG65_20015 [Bacillus sp. Leaf13]|nr:hypothetical protein ASG65_20015 [Bacillus sp. Leaf13]KRF67610.1 hypothetical protein ASG99_15000 [Bacillus sp. Soil768D1]
MNESFKKSTLLRTIDDYLITYITDSALIILYGKLPSETEGFDTLQLKKKGRQFMKNDNQKTSKKQVPAEGSIEALPNGIRTFTDGEYIIILRSLMPKFKTRNNHQTRQSISSL